MRNQVIGYNLPPGRVTGTGEYVFQKCPRCGGKKKFWWNLKKRKGFCYSCETKIGSETSLRRMLGGCSISLPSLLTIPAPEEKEDAVMVPALATNSGRAYVSLRGWDEEFVERIGMRVDPHTETLYIPMLSTGRKRTRPCYMSRKMVTGGKWIFKGPQGERKSSRVISLYREKGDQTGVIVEGAGDLLKHPALMRNGLAVCGARITDVVAYALSRWFSRLIVWTDSDSAGSKLFDNVSKKMFSYGIPVRCYRTPEYKDPGEHPSIQEWYVFLRRAGVAWTK